MRLLILFMLMITTSVYAREVKVEVTPPRPVAGEMFQVLFRVFTESDEEPVINFSPAGVEVVGKSNQGVSTRTIYANGNLTVTREVMILYELVASKPGTSFLRDINVQVGGKNFRHSNVVLTVLKEPEEAAEVFVMADVSKTEVFIGEGIMVRYYLYSKFPVNGLDIKKYPKLNSFLKRFLQEPDRSERVSVRGELYLRHQIYAAKLFPEKVGDLKVDALSLSATYPTTRASDPFGTFGFNREFKTRTFSSEPITINVKPLPAPVPPHFSGLVGKHDFTLNLNQQKLIVNEPLEVKLTVSGPGALENLEAPSVLKHPALEEFESTGDLKINDSESATKVFEYTFLAKENMQLPATRLTLSYLDPETGRYMPTDLSLPEITVAGGSAAARKQDDKAEPGVARKDNPLSSLPKTAQNITGPIFQTDFQWASLLPYVNGTLLGLSLLLAVGWILKVRPLNPLRPSVSIPAEFRKGTMTFGGLARWMSPLIQKTGKSPAHIIRDSDLDDATKSYFLKLLNSMDQKSYSSRPSDSNFEFDRKHFKKLAQYIESASHEDHTKSA